MPGSLLPLLSSTDVGMGEAAELWRTEQTWGQHHQLVSPPLPEAPAPCPPPGYPPAVWEQALKGGEWENNPLMLLSPALPHSAQVSPQVKPPGSEGNSEGGGSKDLAPLFSHSPLPSWSKAGAVLGLCLSLAQLGTAEAADESRLPRLLPSSFSRCPTPA